MSVQYAGGGAWCVTQGGMTVRLEDERSARSVDEMIERLRSELDECRRLLREAVAACEVYLPVVLDDQRRVALLTLEWYEAARAARGEG